MSVILDNSDATILLQAANSLLALRNNLPGSLLSRAQAALRQANLPDWTDPTDQTALQIAATHLTDLLA